MGNRGLLGPSRTIIEASVSGDLAAAIYNVVMTRRILTLTTIALLIVAGCAAAPGPTSEIPFEARAWPADGAAPCAQDSIGRTRPALARIEALDETTVIFRLCAPDPAFVQKLAVGSFVVNDSGWLAAAIANDTLTTTMNGTGPFKFSAWEHGVQIVMTRNDSYWGTPAKAERLIIQWQAEASARLLQLQAGTVDGIDNVGTSDIAIVAADPSIALIPRSGFNTFYINFNNTVKPFDDVRVRTAIALGIDSKRIVENFYPEGSEAAAYVPTCLIEFSCEGPAWHTRDIARAKQLLTEAGFPNGFSTTLALRETPRAYLPDPMGVATDIQAQLSEIGVEVKLEVKDPGTYIDQLLTGQLGGMSISASLPDYPEAWNAVALDFGSDSGPEHGVQYPELIGAIDNALFTVTEKDREAAFAEVNRLLKSLVPVIPIANGASAVALRADVTGFTTSPVVMEDFSTVVPGSRNSFVWLQGGEPAGVYCMDEEDRDTVRICRQVMDGLFTYGVGGTTPVPMLATGCEASDKGFTYTCRLRSGVRFHNGARLDASDVLDSFAAAWDCVHPLHKGRANNFQRWGWIMGTLNQERCQPTP
jgi:peptide/nickel transport system substrate-binding protein